MPSELNKFAPAVFVFLWSTGFIGAKFGLPYAEPFTFLGIRFLIVCAFLLLIVLLSRAPWPKQPALVFHLAISGILIHAIYLGGVFAAIFHGISAGVSAVIVGAQPIITAILVGPLLKEKIRPKQWLGFLLGFVGVTLVVWKNLDLSGTDVLGFTLCIAALFGITLGTIYQKRFCSAMDLRSGGLIQYIAALMVLAACAFAFESRTVVWTSEFIFALSWLSIVLSVGAISLLMILIRQGASAKVASFFYLVPPTTAIMAFIIFDETLALTAIFGITLTAVGVLLVNSTK